MRICFSYSLCAPARFYKRTPRTRPIREHELAPACIARDEERDTELDAAAQGIVSHALWDAGMDCYSDLDVSNARSASLL